MVNRVSIPPSQVPLVDATGKQTREMRFWTNIVTARQMIVGTGSPEGLIEAIQGALYLDDTGTAGAVLYVKRDNDGNTGWILV